MAVQIRRIAEQDRPVLAGIQGVLDPSGRPWRVSDSAWRECERLVMQRKPLM